MDMGMTDKQFNYFLRTIIKELKEIKQSLDDKEKAEEKIEEVLEDLQKTLED